MWEIVNKNSVHRPWIAQGTHRHCGWSTTSELGSGPPGSFGNWLSWGTYYGDFIYLFKLTPQEYDLPSLYLNFISKDSANMKNTMIISQG